MGFSFNICLVIIQFFILVLFIVLICKSYIAYKKACKELNELDLIDKKDKEKEENKN